MTPRLQTYKKYKPSGIGWIGAIPEHWHVKQLKWMTPVKRGASPRPIDDMKYFDDAGEYAWVRISDVSSSNIYLENSEERLSSLGASLSVKLQPGELFLSIAGSVGKACITKIKACIHDGFVYFPQFDGNKMWLYYIFDAKLPFGGLGKFGTQLNLNTDTVGSIYLPVPPSDELSKITEFLNLEISKIDELIKKKEELITLISEKTTSVIDTLVTRGLSQTVEMKKSKFQTLGNIPKHWDVLKIKRIVSTPVTDGPHETPEFLDEGVPFVSAEAVSKGFIDFEKIRGHISPELNQIYSKKYHPDLGDIYMVKSGATTGVTAIVEGRTDFNIWSPLAVIRCSKKMNPYYVLYAMRTKYFQEMISLSWSFGTQQNIGMGVIENLCLPIPPMQEQNEIVKQIDLSLKKLKPLKERAARAIELLKERRSSLISAAITGKIDVRKAV